MSTPLGNKSTGFDHVELLHKNSCFAGELPSLPFETRSFDLALCSHFLFLFSGHFSYDFHLASVQELARLAGEIRIYPLQTLAGKASPYLQPLMQELTAQGYRISIGSVDFEFQRGANQMLEIQSKEGMHDCLPQ